MGVEIEDESYAGDREVYHKLYLYKENTEYRLDLKTRKCNKTEPRHGFHPYGVPDDSKFVAEGTFGVLVSEPNCFPIKHIWASPDGIETTNFYDGITGNQGNHLFDIPPLCLI